MRSEFSLNNLTESLSMIAPPYASDGFKTDSASFLPHFFFCCFNLFMRMLLKIQIMCDACFFSDLAVCSGEYSLFSGSCNY